MNLYIRYTPAEGTSGYVRADQVVAVREVPGRGGANDMMHRCTAIECLGDRTFYAKEAPDELMYALSN